MKRNLPLLLSIFVFLCFQLSVFNLFSGLLDEGFLLYNAKLISQGQIPYRDFFMTTTPGSFYVLAIFFKMFGNYIIIGRILAIFFVVITLYLCSKIFQLKSYWQYTYLLSLSILMVSPAQFFMYNNATLLLIIALYFLILGIEKNKLIIFLISGFISASCFLFKQSVGGLLIPTYTVAIFLLSKKNRFKKTLAYMTGALSLLVPVSLYFIVNHAFSQAIYHIFSFANSVKNHQLSFLIHRIIAIPLIIIFIEVFKRIRSQAKLFLLLLLPIAAIFYLLNDLRRVGRLITYTSDFAFYSQTLVFLFLLFTLSISIKMSRVNKEHRKSTLASISALVIFLSIAASGHNTGSVVAASPLLIPLFIQISQAYGAKNIKKDYLLSPGIIIIISLYVLSFSFNPIRSFGPSLVKDYTEYIPIKEARYIRFIPQQAKDLITVISYIKTYTKNNEKIFCFPYCPGLYFLSDRSGASYYSLFWFETFMENDQSRVIADLQNKDVHIAILQKTGILEQRTELEEKRLHEIRRYITANFQTALITPNFIVLKR